MKQKRAAPFPKRRGFLLQRLALMAAA